MFFLLLVNKKWKAFIIEDLYCSFLYVLLLGSQMALRQCAIVALRNGLGGRQQVAAASSLAKIGNRDVVGYGVNGAANYYDRVDFPMPAIRFKENTPDVMV